MTVHDAADRLATILMPYCRREIIEDLGGPDHEDGWWFAGAPPEVVREALSLVIDKLPGERPNDQPPEEWLVAQAERRGGVLAGFIAPKGPASPRMRVDAVVVPCSQAEDLAKEIAERWPAEEFGTALDLAIVEGLASPEASKHLWDAPGHEFLPWCSTSTHDWLGAAFCSFWWD